MENVLKFPVGEIVVVVRLGEDDEVVVMTCGMPPIPPNPADDADERGEEWIMCRNAVLVSILYKNSPAWRARIDAGVTPKLSAIRDAYVDNQYAEEWEFDHA